MLSGKVGYFRTRVNPAIAAAYIAAVEAADGMTLEPAVRLAITSFIDGCQEDGNWPSLKASCLLLGARTLSGALSPLVGPAPTSINFVSGDYDRKTGLLGNTAAEKRLNINRAIDADPRNNFHQAVFCTVPGTTLNVIMGSGENPTPGNKSVIRFTALGLHIVNRGLSRGSALGVTQSQSDMKLLGSSRGLSTGFWYCFGSVVTWSGNATSLLPQAGWPHGVFCQFTGPSATHAGTHDARLSFYSTGTHVDLLRLHNRLTTLHSAIGAAIP